MEHLSKKEKFLVYVFLVLGIVLALELYISIQQNRYKIITPLHAVSPLIIHDRSLNTISLFHFDTNKIEAKYSLLNEIMNRELSKSPITKRFENNQKPY